MLLGLPGHTGLVPGDLRGVPGLCHPGRPPGDDAWALAGADGDPVLRDVEGQGGQAGRVGLADTIHEARGDWSIFRPKTLFAQRLLAENMDLSPSRGARGTVPLSRRLSTFPRLRPTRRENRDSPL